MMVYINAPTSKAIVVHAIQDVDVTQQQKPPTKIVVQLAWAWQICLGKFEIAQNGDCTH